MDTLQTILLVSVRERVLLALPVEGGWINPQHLGRLVERLGGFDDPADVGLLDGLQRHELADLSAPLCVRVVGKGKVSVSIRGCFARMTARSITLRSSRTLPGHEWLRSRFSASGVSPSID
jgi:hypothetical protein